MLEVQLRAEAATTLSLPSIHNGSVFVIDGSVDVGNQRVALARGQLGWLTRSDEAGISQLDLRSRESPSRLLLFSGPPLREPVVFGGPFVMNTEEQVQQAFRDFANNRL
jgi:quercetin 2,3-dioxygenase